MEQRSAILLESGTNEMELLIFGLGSTEFGINVAKVREIIQRPKVISIPECPSGIEGSFKIREEVLTLVNLGQHFGITGQETQDGKGLVIIVEFNRIRCGILVDRVESIHRMKWSDIAPPSGFLVNFSAPITGTVNVGKETVLIVDFETIIGKVLGTDSLQDVAQEDAQEISKVKRSDLRIVAADDSQVIRRKLQEFLTKAGFENLKIFVDGQKAWEYLLQNKNQSKGACDLVLTDIEMPEMDGLHLTSKIKQDPDLGNIPVIIFSSLVTEDNLKKGEQVGADAQVAKPDSQGMVDTIKKCLRNTGKLVE